MWRLLFSACLLASCSALPETGTAESEIQYTCTKSGSDPAAKWPWEAAYPIGSQHVFCNHQINETSQSAWAPQLSSCVGMPGNYQVDVWVGSDDPNDYGWCSRVTLSGFTHYNQSYEPIMELGWLSNSTDAHNRRRIVGLTIGPGSSVQASSAATTPNQYGCVYPWDGNCISGGVYPGAQVTWVGISPFKTASVDFYRPPNW